MQVFYRWLFSVSFLIVFLYSAEAQELKINEVMSSNTMIVYDEDGDTPDWLEIINSGTSEINLADYYLSENPDNLFKWQMPQITLVPNQPLLIYASGKDRNQKPLYWNTIIDIGQNWKYLVPTSEPSSTWKTYNYSETNWLTGPSGIGYGDNDDKTVVATGVMSVFMRKKFTVSNLSQLKSLWLHMDYDDGFVAYINGTEVCRAGMGAAGSAVSYNTAATSHEAKIYNGGAPDGFDISSFIYLLNETSNVLAIQVHNTGTSSGDLTAIPFLTVGYSEKITANVTQSKYFQMPTLFPHTNFKLSSEGETVFITYKDRTVADSVSYGIIPSNYSFGRNMNDLNKWGFFAEPTPGAINNTAIYSDAVKSEIQFSLDETFLTSPGFLTFSGMAAGEEIRYTLNGNEPTEKSNLYRDYIQISKNTVVRARAFKTGALPGKITSRTYIFDTQPTVPVFSITTDSVNLWDTQTGIYVLGDSYENQNPYFGANFWEDWEKPASIEMTGKDGKRIFSLNCGIKIFGAWSRARDQKSLAIFFKKDYGDPVLKDVQLFKSKPITSFKSFVLRNSGNDYDYARFRDGFMTNLVKDMNTDIQAFEPAVLYLNGKYWGELNLREKVNEDYLESNHGVEADKIDLLYNYNEILEGSNAGYLEMIDFLNKNSLSNDANYQVVANQIDIENYIDYMLSEIYFNNGDWPGNNIKYWRPQTEDGRWRWIMFDTDFGFGLYNASDYTYNTLQFALAPNGPSWPNPPWSTLLFRKLVENNGFKNQFINRFADMLNTTFVANAVISKIDSIAAIIKPEIPANYQKWYAPSPQGWENAVQVMRNFARNRVSYVQNHINQQFVHAGVYDLTLSNSPSNGGLIKLNTIEVSGELWKGKYFENIPVSMTAKAFRGHKFSRWEVDGVVVLDKTIELNLKKATSVKAVYEDEIDDGNSVVINEINYNSPVDKDAGDWVEIFNWGRVDLDISGWIMKDDDDIHQFAIPQNTTLKSKEYLVICRNSANFILINPTVSNFTGDLDFGFGSTGDMVRLFDNTGQLVDSVSFGSESPWPVEPNGNGPTLELRGYTFDNAVADSWKSSTVNSGTPGSVNSIYTGSDKIANNFEKQLQIYPNPFKTETKLRIENNDFEPMQVQIFTMDGRMVRNDVTSVNEYIWKGDDQFGQKLRQGMYICKVQSGKSLYTGKIILSE